MLMLYEVVILYELISDILFIIHSIILFDISPLLFECYPYVGNMQVIQREGVVPSVARVGVIALICNTRGDERLLFYCCYYFS